MILTTSDLGLALSVADRVLFVAAGRIVNTVEGDELRSRYGAAFVVVSYRDDHGPAFATFDIRDLSGAAFRSLTSTKPILSIQTGNLPDDLIFKAETGESMQ